MARGFKGFRRNPDRVIVSISATKTKTTYNIGDALVTSDIRVIATYSDRLTRDVTSKCAINTSAVNMGMNGNYNIVVAYTEGVKTVSTYVPIVINSASYITATKARTSYVQYDALATNDITVIGIYPDGAQKNLTSKCTFNTSAVNMNAGGNYNIIVNCVDGNKTVQTYVTISVVAIPQPVYTANTATAHVDADVKAHGYGSNRYAQAFDLTNIRTVTANIENAVVEGSNYDRSDGKHFYTVGNATYAIYNSSGVVVKAIANNMPRSVQIKYPATLTFDVSDLRGYFYIGETIDIWTENPDGGIDSHAWGINGYATIKSITFNK